MNVTLPNGKIISDVPEGTPKEAIMAKAIAAGLAVESDFPSVAPQNLDVPDYRQEQQPAPQDPNYLAGAANLAGSAIAGLGEQAIEGISGIGGLIMGKTPGEAIASAQAMTAAIPDVELGDDARALVDVLSDKYQQYAPEIVKDVLSAYGSLGETVGESVFQATGSPLLAAGAGILPGALEAATGTMGGKQIVKSAIDAPGRPIGLEAPTGGEVTNKLLNAAQGDLPLQASIAASEAPGAIAGKAAAAVQKISPTKREIRASIESKSGDKIGAGFEVTPYGVVRESPLEQAAMAQGWDQELIGALKNATPKDRQAMIEMTNIRKRGAENMLEKMQNRPARIAGDSLLERYKVVRKANRAAGSAVNQASKNLKGVEVDLSELTANFTESLGDRLNVKLSDEGVIDFTDSIIEKNPAARRALKDLVDLMGRGGRPDAERLHFMKKYIDDNVTYGKAKDGLAGDTERIMKELRYDINEAIRDVSDEYTAANDAYRETITALDNFQDVMGKKVNLLGSGAEEAVGRNLRKVMSNYGVRENLLNSISEIEAIALKHGGTFDDSILLQAGYAQKLDDMFGAVADTSLRGAAGGAIRDAARGDILGAMGNVATGAYKKIKGQTDKKAYESIIELLKPTKSKSN